MTTSSAYETIKANIGPDGRLPPSFTLEPKTAPDQIAFVPGAEDRIFSPAAVDEQIIQKLAALLKEYFKTESAQCLSQIEAVLEQHRAISLIDPLLQSIRENHEGIDVNNLVNFSFRLAKASANLELIKIAVGMFGLLDLGNVAQVRDIVYTLGLYEEFTLYAAVAASNWTGGNQMIFQLAKNVSGWGKIGAVECIAPDSQEIREWILREGCANHVMDAYLGLPCAVKGDLICALRQDWIDDELFHGIAIIIEALLDEGPARGISVYEYAQEALLRYLTHAKQHVSSVEHLRHILNLRDWAENAKIDYQDAVLAGCDEIINWPEWPEKIVAAAKRRAGRFELFCACRAADYMGIDISALLFEAVQSDLQEYGSYIPDVMKRPEMALQIIGLCEAALPLNIMAQGMGNYFFADRFRKEYQCLEYALLELGRYPLKGVRLVKTALNCPIIRQRNAACRVLSEWSKLEGKPLSELSPELYAETAGIHKAEVNEKTKEFMQKLLDGETGDDQ